MSDVPGPIIRNERGQIMPGSNTSGHRKGKFNKLTARMREEFSKYADEHGERANPLVCLAEIMMGEKTEDAVRVAAASKLASFLIPKKFEIDAAEPDEERIEKLKRFRMAVMGALPHGQPVLIEGETQEVNP